MQSVESLDRTKQQSVCVGGEGVRFELGSDLLFLVSLCLVWRFEVGFTTLASPWLAGFPVA